MPQLLGHYQKKVTATRLKRAYNVIAQTIERSKVDYGDVSGWGLERIVGDSSSFANRQYIRVLFATQFWEPWIPAIRDRYYGTAKEFGYETINDKPANTAPITWYILNDGTIYGIDALVAGNEDKWGNINGIGYFVDVNGFAKPNLYGRDIFLFKLNLTTGNVIDNSENFARDELIDKCRNSRKDSGYSQYYCTILIAYDGWEIKPDYPW